MLNSILHFSIKNKLAIGGAVLLLIIWGSWSALQLPIDAVPDITNNQVQVITNSPNLATQEVEHFITFPIEQAMANLPQLEEVRSISRFGLSVITLVFDDDVDIYFARQLISERLTQAQQSIPKSMGIPEMGPVSTGLGEVYQYIIHPKPEAMGDYNAMDLRSMQDWVVRRQLQGTPGVAEIISFGGKLKQYEVMVNPERLRALNVTMAELFTALEQNNENTGGAYIDKQPNAYFIRSVGLVKGLDDIRNMLVKHSEAGVPLLIKDVAEVGFGHAPRYGAVTYNGEKEVVGGIVMMLKGENSAEVVKQVKARMATIQSSLPDDVIIEAFLDRTDLIDHAISTVEKNLIEGALIVLLVLVLFLGNLRAGLIVASAIPLAMLFALGMMNLFGVSANLMSLGAIDFGLIVDGAVIMVEATLYLLASRQPGVMTQSQMDEAVFTSSSSIRNSAAFGEIIILLVYIPILTLPGIEGKMFRPMAQTVGFAILGALLLSLTYIPMMCALCLPKNGIKSLRLSDKMMEKLQSWYRPVLMAAIKVKYAVLGVSIALLVVAVIVFSRMGGEFIPQLQEGDYAFHCILPQGSSLSQSVETSMLASRVIMSFPEVKTVVGKTGSAEIPTDPMPPEASDLIIVLKPRSEWTTTKDYNELAVKMMEKLSVIPGIFFEMNQPIQMRFNELMTGVRQDVAVKIFGENVDTLAAIAKRVQTVINSVEGVAEPQIEQTTGLPQITITPDRLRLANYGISVAEVNDLVSAAFAGKQAGLVYEDERRFSLVVRLDTAYRGSIANVSNLYIPLHDGSMVPLHQVATIGFTDGPAQISREDAQRRIVVGFNVQDRDVQSVVEDIQAKLDKAKLLPQGYYYTYGGTFENLKAANERLMIAVPIALLIIFVLLYFTFRSVGQSLLIFMAIPMAAIGGVFALLLRGMPFSISAGVGFIALFGVAVLNGIVLISTFNKLCKDDFGTMLEIVKEGTMLRLRPVLMTAAVASLGFLPMALSTSAGAEVQRPLATVVIGGLLTATLLTLILLPILYLIFQKGSKKISKPLLALMLFAFIPFNKIKAQDALLSHRITLSAAIDSAVANNYGLQARTTQTKQAAILKRTAWDIDKTGFFIENEDMRPTDHKGILKMGLSQTIKWPGYYTAQRKALGQEYELAGDQALLTKAKLVHDVSAAYFELCYQLAFHELYATYDSAYTRLAEIAELRVKAGEAAGLEAFSATARQLEMATLKTSKKNEVASQQLALAEMLNSQERYLPLSRQMPKAELIQESQSTHPALAVAGRQVLLSDAKISVEKNKLLPTLSARVFSQRLYGIPDPYTGFSVSVGLPLFARAEKARIKVARLDQSIAEKYQYQQIVAFDAANRKARLEVERLEQLLQFYTEMGENQAAKILASATLAWQGGEITFLDLNSYYVQALELQKSALNTLHDYNVAVTQLNYYFSKP